MSTRAFLIKTTRDYDVIVVGGGTTGIAAAMAAARHGARTAIIDYLGFLGGNAVNIPAWMGFHNLSGQQVVGGIAQELVDKLRAVDGATQPYLDPITGSVVGVSGNWLKVIAAQEVQAAGVDIWLHSLVVDVESDGSSGRKRAKGVYLWNREGLHYYTADVIVDCTDSGDAARLAGAQLVRGRDTDHKVQVSSWTVTVGNVDFEKLLAYFSAHPREIRPFPLSDQALQALLRQMWTAEVFVMGSFYELISHARADGLELPRTRFPAVAFPPRGEIMHVGSRVEDVDPNDAANYTRAEIEGMRQTQLWMEFLRRYVPGCENCRLVNTPSHIGMRETNHLVGEYTLTRDDLMTGQPFDDVIALGGYHLDIHTPDHGGLETERPPTYQIPYRCLVPKGVDGVLVAGRVISATHEALSSTRVIPISMAQGQAAGTAAALAVRLGIEPRDVPIAELQAVLRKDRAILSLPL